MKASFSGLRLTTSSASFRRFASAPRTLTTCALKSFGQTSPCHDRSMVMRTTTVATRGMSVSGVRTFSAATSAFPMPNPPEYPHCDDPSFVGKTGAQIFHDLLIANGVDQVFGYPGGAILPVYDAIYQSPHFNFTLPRHEQGGGHMAEGYARATGKPGVVLVTSGPGATNVITPMQDALMDGTPLVVFTGQVPTFLIGTDSFQEADVTGLTRSCTKWNTLVTDIRDLPRRINEAFYVAQSGRPGPVLVDLPKDITAGTLNSIVDSTPTLSHRIYQKELAERRQGVRDAFGRGIGGLDNGETFDRILSMINEAKQPIIYAGQGVISAGDRGVAALRAFAEKANIPVTTTLQGMGAFDELHPLSLHMLGMHGSAYANFAMQNADLVITLGARFDDRVTGDVKRFAPEARRAETEGRGGIIHFEISPKNISKVVSPTEAVIGDVAASLEALLPHVAAQERAAWFEQIDEWKELHPFSWDSAPDGAMKGQQVIEEMMRQTADRSEDVICTTGVGQHQMWAAQFYRWRHPRTFITSGGSGTMGFGLPAAIGAKLGAPDKIVVDIDGDASFSMTCQELLTAAQYNIGVKALVLNNNFQGMVRQWQDLFYDERHSQTEMFNPCFAGLAKASGCHGIRCEKAEDLPEAMAEFLAHDGPVVLDAVVAKDEHVYPMVPAGSALHEMVLGPPSKEE